MAAFSVRYRSRGDVREVRWHDGVLEAEPLVEVLVTARLRGTSSDLQTSADAVNEALYEIGAHVIAWAGDIAGLAATSKGKQPRR